MLVDYEQFGNLIKTVSELAVHELNLQYEKYHSITEYRRLVCSNWFRPTILELPLFKEICNQIREWTSLIPLYMTVAKDGWLESALIDYIAMADSHKFAPDDLNPSKENIEHAITQLKEDLSINIPLKRVFALITGTLLSVPCIELNKAIRIRRLTRFELHAMYNSDFYQSLGISKNMLDASYGEDIVEYIGSDLEQMSLKSAQNIAGDAILNVLMCLRLYENSNSTVSNIWIGLGSYDKVTSAKPRPEFKKTGFPSWDLSHLTHQIYKRPESKRMPFRRPVIFNGEKIDQFKQLWTIFSDFRNERPYTKHQVSYETALLHYNKAISEDSPDYAANILSSAIDALLSRGVSSATYRLMKKFLLHGSNKEYAEKIISRYQSNVRHEIEHGGRVDEKNYRCVFEMGELVRTALKYTLFFSKKFGTFKTKKQFCEYIEENELKIPEIVPDWALLDDVEWSLYDYSLIK